MGMKGLEESIELEERELEFKKIVIFHLTAIVFSSVSLIKECVTYINERIEE